MRFTTAFMALNGLIAATGCASGQPKQPVIATTALPQSSTPTPAASTTRALRSAETALAGKSDASISASATTSAIPLSETEFGNESSNFRSASLNLAPAGTGEMREGLASTESFALPQSRCGSSGCAGCGR